MSTKNYCHSLRDKRQIPDRSFSCNNSKYNDFNLNQQSQPNNVDQSQSFPAFGKSKNSFVFHDNNLQTNAKNCDKSRKKSPIIKHQNLSGFVKGDLQLQKCNRKPPRSKSTLSLHIKAYENLSASDTFDDTYCKTKAFEERKSIASKSVVQSSFEFARQQEDQINDPEIMQFKTSQKLLNSNLNKSSTISMKNILAILVAKYPLKPSIDSTFTEGEQKAADCIEGKLPVIVQKCLIFFRKSFGNY
jgi:hypothetical protein